VLSPQPRGPGRRAGAAAFGCVPGLSPRRLRHCCCWCPPPRGALGVLKSARGRGRRRHPAFPPTASLERG
jgi:hypothetical protein